MSKKYVVWGVVAVLAYVVYRNFGAIKAKLSV